MKAYTAYISVKFTKRLYLVNVSNSSEVRLWESARHLLLPGWPAAEQWPASRLGKSKEVAAATAEEEKKPHK